MRINDHVLYVATDGQEYPAVVTAVSGAGESGYKVLDLGVGDVQYANVVYLRDETGDGHWTFPRAELFADAPSDAPAAESPTLAPLPFDPFALPYSDSH